MKALLTPMTAIMLATLTSAGAATGQGASRPAAPAQSGFSSGRSVNVSANNTRLSALTRASSPQARRREQHGAEVTIVPGKQTTSELMATLTEDLGIMARIVDKKLQEACPATSATWVG